MSTWPSSFLVSGSLMFSAFSSFSVSAQTVSGTVDVSMELEAACEVNGSASASGVDFGSLAFGSHTSLFEQADAMVLNNGTAIEVLCSPGVEPSVRITGGANDAQGGSANHAMSYLDNYIPYTLYTDVGRSSALNVNVAHSLVGTADGTTPQTLELYGRAFGQPGLASGTYTDTLNIELAF